MGFSSFTAFEVFRRLTVKKDGKVDLHLNLKRESFTLMEQLRQRKSRTAFIEDLIQTREKQEYIIGLIEKVRANQKRIFAILILIASYLGITQEDIQKTIETKDKGVE